VITRRGLLALAAVALLAPVAAPLGVSGWAVAAGDLLVVAAIAADWLSVRPATIEVDRPEQGPFSVGRPNPVALTVWNAGPSRVLVVAEAEPAAAELEPVTHRLRMAAGEERVLQAHLTPSRRGPLRFAAVEVRMFGPLGMAFRERSFKATAAAAAVWPDVLQLRDERLLPPGRRLGGARLRRAEAAGREFESLRDYVPGDEYRRIAWKATARRGKPVVAVQQPERRQTLLLVLEAGRLMLGEGGGGLAKLDRAVNAAVMLAAVARESDDAVGVATFADRPQASLPPAARAGQVRRVVDVLARAEPWLVEPDWARGLAEAGRLSRRRAMVVVFSDALYLETDPLLAARLGRLARRHLVVFASLRDAGLAAMAEQPVAGGATLYERGLATAVLGRRAGALSRLERGGVNILDAAPELLTAEIVHRFRALRAGGVL
jgi:uncharacterized protein (DUF58 family)